MELSTSISHEIVQPVSAVVTNARAALNWLSSESPNIDRAKSAIEGIPRDGMAVGNVSLDLTTELPNTDADPIQIQQVLLNLIRNAFEAVLERASGQREIKIRTLFSENEVAVDVEDSGFGISTPERIFEAFFTSKNEGLGVGLSISRSIAEAHGGALVATNLEDGGARFSLTLPRSFSPTETV